MNEPSLNQYPEIILGNSSRKFSGVTSTMLQVLKYQQKKASVFVLGSYFLPPGTNHLTFWGAIRRLQKIPTSGLLPVFHARRNDEMIQAVLLKYFFNCKMKIVFTSTAQRKKSWITRWLIRRMDGVITTCEAAASYLVEPADVMIPHGVDTQAFNSTRTLTKTTHLLPFKQTIGIFGRVRSQKGVDLLVNTALEILPKFPDWGVVIIGELTAGNEAFKGGLIKKISDLNMLDRFVFTDKVAFDALPQYFSEVSIVTALSVNEGFGLTVLEGMACSKPVIATKAGAWPDILEKGNVGRLIEIGDHTALGNALFELMGSEDLRSELGKNGHQLVLNHYTVEREAQQLLDFYTKISSR